MHTYAYQIKAYKISSRLVYEPRSTGYEPSGYFFFIIFYFNNLLIREWIWEYVLWWWAIITIMW